MNRRNVMAGVVLGLIGFAANWFRLDLYLSVSFLFGSFFVMLAILRYGTVAGIIAGIIASTSTIFIWGHPWAVVTFGGEALFVAWAVRRRPNCVIISDVVYWLCCGVPLVWILFHHVLGLQVQATVLIMLKESINGIFNALLAMLAHMAIQSRRSDKSDLLSFRQLIFVAMVSLTLIPAFIVFTFHLRGYIQQEQKRLVAMTLQTAELTSHGISGYLRERRDTAGIDQNRIREIITAIRGERDVQVTLLDRNSRVVASTRPDLAPMERFSVPAGEETHLEGSGVYHWVPARVWGQSTMERFGASLFVKEMSLDTGTGWIVRIETPVLPLFGKVSTESITALLLMMLLVLTTVCLSALISRKLVHTLHQLKDVTKALPGGRLSELVSLQWPESRIAEMDGLIANFKQMTYAFYMSFAELKNLNETLEQRVEERTTELSESEARYRLLAENASDLIFRYRLVPDHVCLYTSPASKRLLGYAPEEFYADVDLPFKLVHPDDRPVLEQTRRGVVPSSGYQLRWLHRDGRTVWLDTRITVVSPPDGSFVEIIGISRDVTDLKLREILARELEDKKTRMGIMEKEERHLREKEMLVKDLHDGIGGIVTNITMLGQYGLQQTGNRQCDECRETFTKIVGLASEGSTEIRSFMNSLENGESSWSDLLAEIKGYSEKMFEPHEISFGATVRITDGIPPIGLFRYVNIVRICREIITNIIKHAKASEVMITFDVTAERCELSLVDNGVGYHPDTVKRRGLGNMLSRAREIGAELSLASSPGGSSVKLVLPLAGGES